ncbi:MAG TPA: 3' terminal RNA ribose 2'-O-methyltransferase Hen1 [Trebonia sp.]|nr:3' terminal RNA ribose 2'-O-methyltransferase Hen1 [Trebonia sp.]
MLATISTTHVPATDLGYLLHKHPARAQSRPVASGRAHVFYPEASENRCTAALLLEVDPVALVRGKGGDGQRKGKDHDAPGIAHYVNDRPYAASSLLAVALKEMFGTALTGRCDARPELAAAPIPLEIRVPALRCAGMRDSGGAELARALFTPLGWATSAEAVPLDPPEWGRSRYVDLRLTGTLRLADALNHLYVLLPVLDDAKHYWVASDEIDKLVRAGEGWLATHPEKALITRRYLAHQKRLTTDALARLADVDDLAPEELDNAVPADNIERDEGTRPVALAVQRHAAVLAAIRESGARSVGDFGCGDGALTRHLLGESGIERIVAADVSARALVIARRRLRLDRLPDARRARITLIQSALTYRDERLKGLDAAVLMEVIEHVDADRLPALERSVFGFACPATVIVTTPNREHNVVYGMTAGAVRHHDHRWEWDRAEFRAWADATAAAYGYDVRITGVGLEDPVHGAPTQLAVFTRAARDKTEGAA